MWRGSWEEGRRPDETVRKEHTARQWRKTHREDHRDAAADGLAAVERSFLGEKQVLLAVGLP